MSTTRIPTVHTPVDDAPPTARRTSEGRVRSSRLIRMADEARRKVPWWIAWPATLVIMLGAGAAGTRTLTGLAGSSGLGTESLSPLASGVSAERPRRLGASSATAPVATALASVRFGDCETRLGSDDASRTGRVPWTGTDLLPSGAADRT